jgi:dTDP-4-dehydrorhamnose reductase/SAM-dependent methyltransferase
MNILTNALVTGGSGMIGSNINFGYKPSSNELDITSLDSVNKYLKNKDISCIIHLASINLRESENNISKAINVNINGTINMLKIAINLDVPFILVSTGAVFSSENSNVKFDENNNTCPNCVYGYTKTSSEKVALLYKKSIIIRTGWLFGGNQKTHYKFVENTINYLITNNEVRCSNNFYGSPTYVIDFINKMCELINNLSYGIHNIVNDGYATGYDIAYEIATILNADKNLLISVNSENVPNSGPPRSKTEMLETNYPINKLRSWKEALSEYLEKYITNKIILNKNESKINYNISIPKFWKNREICRFCKKKNLHVFFKLEETPLANHFISNPIKQESIPLDISICKDCSHIQLIQIVDPEIQYSNYFYVSSTSETMTNHLKNSVIDFTNYLNISKNDNILEIGANDGVCISHLLENGFKNIIGVDPAKNINERHNLPIICDFFGSNILDELKNKYNSFKLIYAFHCCAHIEDLDSIFETIYKLLDDEGTFIMEVGYFYEVFKNRLFDTIYHEHIDYHTCTAMQKFAINKNLLLYKTFENSIQGGSIQFFFCKNNIYKRPIDVSVFQNIEKEQEIQLFNLSNLYEWKNFIIKTGNDMNYILNSLKQNGKKIAGYGASAKSTTLLHQYKLTKDLLEFIIDDNIYKENFYSPGLHIPIKNFNSLQLNRIDYIVILSWNFTNEIIKKLEPFRKNGLRVIIPFPNITII